MNREDIIRMARECFADLDGSLVLLTPELSRSPELSRFAALVAAAEREECAQICDTESANESSFWEKGGWVHACGNCAALIRARGQA